jgi:hypothetical protein
MQFKLSTFTHPFSYFFNSHHEDTMRYTNGLEIAMTHHTKTKSYELQRSMTDLISSKKQATGHEDQIADLKRKLTESEQKRKEEIKKRDESISESQRQARVKEEELETEIQGLHHSILPPSLANMSMDRRKKKKAGVGGVASVMDGPSELNVSDLYQDTAVMVVTIVQFNRLVDVLSQTPHRMIELLKYYHAAIDAMLQAYPKVYCVERISDTCIFTSNAPDRNERAVRDLW